MNITLLTKPVPINHKHFVVNGRNILSKKYREAKKDLQLEFQCLWKEEITEEPIAVNIIQYFGDNRKRDIDAYIKILLDAAEGIVYKNDNQITEMHVYKEKDKDNPRVEFSIV